jgi:hypothetical protein
MSLTETELQELRNTKRSLENPSLVARVGHVVGMPIDSLVKGFMKGVPAKWNAVVTDVAREAVNRSFDVAVWQLDVESDKPPYDRLYKIAVTTSGAAGGLFGLSGLVAELPVSTIVMMRSIVDIARSNGEDLRSPEARLQCLQVLAMGGPSPSDDGADLGYFGARATIAKAVQDAATYIAKHGVAETGAPAIVRFISQIASRYSIVVSQKTAAQAVPLVGAFGGAMINALFIDHFQTMARGHFTVRRLERIHGADEIRSIWESIGETSPSVD